MPIVFLGLGTNVGDRKANLAKAIESLEKADVHIEKISSVYETEPVGVEDQDWFYNMVIKAKTNLKPDELLRELKDIEQKMGRQHTYRWGPRLIDIDLLTYDDLQLDKKLDIGNLKLPHPQLKNRAFVIIPILEIEPEASLPDGHHVSDFLESIKDQHVRKLENE